MAIHEQNYVRYDGPLRTNRAWAVIAWSGFRTYLSFLRTKLVLLLLWLLPFLYCVFIFLEYTLRGSGVGDAGVPPSSYVSFFLQIQVLSVFVLLLASGCGVVSEDLRYRTFQLYFSKPIARRDYAIGKFLSILLLTSLVSVIPAAILTLLRGALFIRSDVFKPVMVQMGVGVLLSLLFAGIMCSVVAGLSSLTRSQGTVVLSFLGVIVVPQILSLIVAIAGGGSEGASNWLTGTASPAHLWSLTGNMLIVSQWILNGETFDGPAWAAPLILAIVTAAGIGAMARRISRLEGVA